MLRVDEQTLREEPEAHGWSVWVGHCKVYGDTKAQALTRAREIVDAINAPAPDTGERARSLAAALNHSCQADGTIERQVAMDAARELRELAESHDSMYSKWRRAVLDWTNSKEQVERLRAELEELLKFEPPEVVVAEDTTKHGEPSSEQRAQLFHREACRKARAALKEH